MKINRHHARFTVGEYSRAAITRVDLDDTQLAAEIQENLIPSLAGDARFRPGTEYLDTTRDNEQARLIPFVRDTDDFALIEMTAGKLRIIVDDAFITRPTVTSTLVNPNFDLGTGWTTAASAGAYSNIQSGTYNNQLVMGAFAQGSNASAVQAVTIPAEELGTVHALRIDVFRGPVLFRIGSTSGGQEVVSEQILQRGTHSLAFTPTAAVASTYYIWFGTRFETEGVVNSCQFESGGIMNLDAPWTTAELREVSFDQAADVVYFAHENWIPHQLTRRGATSWSMTEFQQDGGPTELVTDGTRISISATRNQAVVTATEDYFSSSMVGTVLRAFHDRLDASYLLAGDGEFTEPWVVRGIKGKKNNDRKFSYQVTGFGSGTMHMQRSISGEDGDYLDHIRDDGSSTTITGNFSATVNGKDEDANLVAWHRIGFKEDGDYGSGAIQINVQYQGMGGFGWGRIIDYYSPRQVLIEIIDKFHSTGEANLWNIGTWNTSVPWPSCVALSDNRLWFGGRSQIWASALNDYANFDDIDTSALRTLTRTLGSSGASSNARWFLPLQRLIAGTEGAQVSIRAGAFDQGVTADNVTLKDAATVGANYVSPVKLDSRGVFVHGSGSDMYVLKPGQNDYVAERMTVHNDEILDLGVVELAAQRQPETMVWAVRSDGQVPVCMYEFEGDVDTKTWWRFITAGDVESVAVLPGAVEDRIYMVVNRTPDPDDESITGAEELAPSGVDVFSADLTDQSVLVVDSGTPANDLNTDQRFDEWGNIVGLETIVSQNTSDLKLTMQSSGYLGYQPHNLAPSSYDFTVSGFAIDPDATIGTSPNTTYPAPDGVGAMQKIILAPGSTAAAGINFDVNIPGAGTGGARVLAEISFYTKYEQGEGDAMPEWRMTYTGFYGCLWRMDELNGLSEGIYLGPVYDDTDDILGFYDYLDDRVLVYDGDPAPSYAAFDQPAIAYIEGSTVYLRLRHRFYIEDPETTISIYPDGATGNGLRGGYIWGLQCNLLPTAEQLAGGYSQLVQHNSNAPRILLPYEWDNAGALEGIRVEPAGDNLLASGTDFTASDFTPSALEVSYTGNDRSPNGLNQGTQLIESQGGLLSSAVFLNQGFEDTADVVSNVTNISSSSIPDWTIQNGTWYHLASGYGGLSSKEGLYYILAGTGASNELIQDRDITEFASELDIDAGGLELNFSAWIGTPFTNPSPADTVEISIKAYDEFGSYIGELYSTGAIAPTTADVWEQYSQTSIAIPTLTRTLRCEITIVKNVGTYSYICVDGIETSVRNANIPVAPKVHKLSHPIFGLDGQYCASTYVYPGELTYLALRLQGASGESFLVNFNVDTGVVNLESASGVANAEAGVEALPFGCYQIWITGTLSVEPDPGVMTSTGVTTTSMVALRQPAFDSTGTSTVTWGVEGIETGTATMAGTSQLALRGDFVLVNNLVVNGNFDGGTFYGWNGGIGPTGEIVSTTPPGAYEGNFYLYTTSGGSTFVSQYIDLTQVFTEAELDSGTAQLDMGMAAIKLFEDTSAAAFMGGQWLTAGSGYIANFTAISNNSLPLDTWTELSTTVTIPTTTRILRLYVYDSGSSPDSHAFDAIYVREAGTPAILEPTLTASGSSTVTWGDPPVPPADPGTELLTNGGFEDDFTGWTEGTGGQYFPSSTTPPGAYEGTRYARIASTTFSTLNQQVDLHDGFDPSVISDGLAELYISAAYTKDGTDPNYSAEIDLAFYDSGLSLISSSNILSDTSITQDVWKTSGDIVESVPTNARYAEIILYSEDPDFFAFYDINWDAVSMKANAIPRPVLTSDGIASVSFTANQITPITMGGAATAAMSGGGTFPMAMSSAGIATSSLVGFPDYRIQSNGSATTAWSPIVSTASAGVATASFGTPAAVGTVTMAGSSSVTWGVNTVEQGAIFSIILSDVESQTVTSQNEISFAAQSSRGVVVWGAQLEYGRNRPSSFISRTSTELRAADAYTIDNASIPLSDTAVSMFAEIKRSHAEAGTILGIADGADALNLELDSSAQSLHRVRDDGGDVAYIVDGVAVENTLTRLASSAQVDDAKFVVDGGSALTDTSMTMPAVSGGTTYLGSGYDGIISRIMILPQASSEEALQGYGLVQEPPTYRYIEKLALKSEAIGGSTNKMADSGAFFAGPASTVTCAWLVERTDVVAWATNASGLAVPLTGLTSDVDGNIDLGGTYTNIWVGLGYTARYRSGKLAFQNRGGTALLQRKRVAELGVLLENTHRDAIRFGEDFDRMRHMNLVKAGAIQAAGTIYSTYDDKSFSFPGSWNTDARLCLEVQAPYPATLLGLVIGLEWHERGLG